MKKIISICIVCVLTISLVACGNQKPDDTENKTKQINETTEINENDQTNKGIFLPTRMENINTGGEIPEGSEPEQQIKDSKYPNQSLWGTWVPEKYYSTQTTVSAQTATYLLDEETGEETESEPIELKVFPKTISFRPPWDDLGKYSISVATQPILSSSDMEVEEKEYDNTILGQALANQNLGQGWIDYPYIVPDDPMDGLSLIDGGCYNIAYGISGDTLAIGIISSREIEPKSFNIKEIDYTISFSGWKLTLTYGDESLTYIPEDFDETKKIDLYENGIEPEYNNIDGILGITYRDTLQEVMYDIHEGYVDAKINLDETGTCTIDASNGKNNELKYLLSSHMLTLISESGTGVYSTYRSGRESMNVSAGTSGGLMMLESSGASINIDGKTIAFSGTTNLQKLLDCGFTTLVDTHQALKSCVVSNEIELQKSDVNIKVKVVNPWEKEVALRDCKICDVYVDDPSGTITTNDDSEIGVTQYETMEQYFEAAYEKTPDLLRYKVYSQDFDFALNELENGQETKYGEELLNIRTDEMELHYHFENGVLKSFEIQCPELLYNGLQDNVNNEALADMDEATMTGIIKTRDDVLTKLNDAFINEGININVNESTGEVVMDSNVLFETDSYSLSEKGKKYIDSFMGVYASVILDNSLKDIISEVRFEGHTDSNGEYDYNLKLSQNRADAVLDYCLESGANNMDSAQKNRLKDIANSIGYSYSDLVYDSEGNEDEDASRRVAIKFYIKTGTETKTTVKATTEANVAVHEDEEETSNILSKDDFQLIENGKYYNVFEKVSSSSAWYFSFSPQQDENREKVVITHRNIHIGDSLKAVIAAYGDTDRYVFDSDNPFYDEDDGEKMLDECKSFLVYEDKSNNMILFFLDEKECVSWIVYYVA